MVEQRVNIIRTLHTKRTRVIKYVSGRIEGLTVVIVETDNNS